VKTRHHSAAVWRIINERKAKKAAMLRQAPGPEVKPAPASPKIVMRAFGPGSEPLPWLPEAPKATRTPPCTGHDGFCMCASCMPEGIDPEDDASWMRP